MLNRIKPWQKILIGLITGIIAGHIFGQSINLIKPIGDLFIQAIHMIIVPIVFLAIVNAISSIENLTKMKRLSIKAFIIYSILMIIASTIALVVTHTLEPGKSMVVTNHLHDMAHNLKPKLFSQLIRNIIPRNVFKAFVDGNILQILIFSIVFGLALNLIKEASKPVVDFMQSAFQIIIKIAQIIMKLAPIGVFSLISCAIAKYGLHALFPLIKLIISVYASCLLLWCLYSIIIFILTKKSPMIFYKKILNPIIVSYTTSSSAVTLPITLISAKKELNINKEVADFLLPLGTSLNLNGLSIYLSTTTIFSANIYGVHLSLLQYITIPFLILITALGAAAIPGASLIVMGAIQSSLGIPLGAISLIAAVDRLNDMMQTCTNVVGDLFSAYIINYSENQTKTTISCPEQITNFVVDELQKTIEWNKEV